jgi:hypothetical protein
VSLRWKKPFGLGGGFESLDEELLLMRNEPLPASAQKQAKSKT